MVRQGLALVATSVVRPPERQLPSSLLSVCPLDDSHAVGQTAAGSLQSCLSSGWPDLLEWGKDPEVVVSVSGFLTVIGHFDSTSPTPWSSWKFLKDFSRTLATFTGSIWGQKHMYFVLSKPFINLGTLGHTQTREMRAGHCLKKISQYLISLPWSLWCPSGLIGRPAHNLH